jgi:hypothetical protein
MGGEPYQEGKRVKNTIVYGPLNDIPPLSTSPCNFHYEYKDPIITITSLKREMEVSHWGANLAVEEYYALRHDGAKYVIKRYITRYFHQIAHELVIDWTLNLVGSNINSRLMFWSKQMC